MSSNSTSLPDRKRSAPSGTAKVAKVAKVAKTKDCFIVPDHEGEAFTLAPNDTVFVRETHLAVRQHAEWEAEARKAEARKAEARKAEARKAEARKAEARQALVHRATIDAPGYKQVPAPIIQADFWERMDDAAAAELEAEFVFDSNSADFAFMCQSIQFPTPE